jgi:hypothetical protein
MSLNDRNLSTTFSNLAQLAQADKMSIQLCDKIGERAHRAVQCVCVSIATLEFESKIDIGFEQAIAMIGVNDQANRFVFDRASAGG